MDRSTSQTTVDTGRLLPREWLTGPDLAVLTTYYSIIFRAIPTGMVTWAWNCLCPYSTPSVDTLPNWTMG